MRSFCVVRRYAHWFAHGTRGNTVERQGGLTYQPALDGLRAFAVASVIAYHFGAGWMTGGFLGVDVFFLLSRLPIRSMLLNEWERCR